MLAPSCAHSGMFRGRVKPRQPSAAKGARNAPLIPIFTTCFSPAATARSKCGQSGSVRSEHAAAAPAGTRGIPAAPPATRVSRTSDGRLRHHIVAGAGANAKRELPTPAPTGKRKVHVSVAVRKARRVEQPRSLASSRQQGAAPRTLHPAARAVAQAAAQTHRVLRGAAVGRTDSFAAALMRATISEG